MARVSTARKRGNGDRVIERACNATSPMNTTSPMTSIVTATPAEEWSSGGR